MNSKKNNFVLAKERFYLYPIFISLFGLFISFFLFLADHGVLAIFVGISAGAGTYICLRLPRFTRIRIFDSHFLIRNGRVKFNIQFNEILDFRFLHNLDSESGITWAFEICTSERDWRIGSEYDLEKVLEFVERLVIAMAPAMPKNFSANINTQGVIMESNENGLFINGIKVKSIEYSRQQSYLDAYSNRFIVDENSKLNQYNLDQRMVAFYIYLAKARGQIKTLFFWLDYLEMESEKT